MVGLVLIVKAIQINCHGRLLNPVARTSAWRLFPNIFPAYYDDNQMFCGGVQTLWEQNGTHHLIKRVGKKHLTILSIFKVENVAFAEKIIRVYSKKD